ncbi:MAG TPA: DUF309 domain-containing protein [Verrucomicrobiales bacterium]|nr:DUF309 domain-containing protein [Verrucomicrobiales bacterium]
MSHKSPQIAARIERFRGGDVDPHFLGFLDCFNHGLYYEAHDVLEELWLARRRQPEDGFYKGLIQLAGAFVHLQKGRLKPAGALFRLSTSYLTPYGPSHLRLDLCKVLALEQEWLGRLEASGYTLNPLANSAPPCLTLEASC